MDPAGTQAAIEAAVEAEPVIDEAPTFIDSDLDRAREVADRLRAGVEVSTVDPHQLARSQRTRPRDLSGTSWRPATPTLSSWWSRRRLRSDTRWRR